jgi:hypothetical protein
MLVRSNDLLLFVSYIANKIGEAGMKSLLDAVQYQSQLAVAHSRQIAVGLLRLSVKVISTVAR